MLQSLQRVQRALLSIEQGLDIFDFKEKALMIDPSIAKLISAIDDATNAIAARLQRLIDAANAAGSQSAGEIVAALQPEVARLTALGADPANPVPTT
jgi:hypothetical protein